MGVMRGVEDPLFPAIYKAVYARSKHDIIACVWLVYEEGSLGPIKHSC